MTKSSAPLGSMHSSLDTAYAKSRATSAVMLDLERAAGHLILHVCQLSHDMLLIKLKPFLSGCLISLLGSQTGEDSGSFTHSERAELNIFRKSTQKKVCCYVAIMIPHTVSLYMSYIITAFTFKAGNNENKWIICYIMLYIPFVHAGCLLEKKKKLKA